MAAEYHTETWDQTVLASLTTSTRRARGRRSGEFRLEPCGQGCPRYGLHPNPRTSAKSAVKPLSLLRRAAE